MAIIQMWPPNQGLRNSISFDGRTYSSVPGVSIPVPGFDMPVLQANGWTTYPTVAGKTTITMLPPANSGHNQLTINGRTYVAAPGVAIEVQPFDSPVLEANGWSLVTAIVLQGLTLSANSFTVRATQGTAIGSVQGATAGSSLSLTGSDSGAVQLVAGVLEVGATPPGSPGNFNIQITETLAGASNSPNATVLSISENADDPAPILQLRLKMTVAFPLAA